MLCRFFSCEELCPLKDNICDALLQKSLSSLELPRVVSVANGATLHGSVGVLSSVENSERSNGDMQIASSSSEYSGRNKHKLHDPARDISIQVLEKFSLVTKFARETTSHLFRENHNNDSSIHERKQFEHKPSIASTDTQKISSAPVAPDPLEVRTEVPFLASWLVSNAKFVMKAQ